MAFGTSVTAGNQYDIKDCWAMVDSFHNTGRVGEFYIYICIFYKKKDRGYKIGRVGNRKHGGLIS